MCGLFGHYTNNRGADSVVLRILANENGRRGRVGHGIWMWDDDGDALIRRIFEMHESQVTAATGHRASGFHLRAPTGGQGGGTETLHPFSTDRFILAHNGVLVNWKENEQYARWRHGCSAGYLATVDVDSTVILAGIQTQIESPMFDTPEAVRYTMERVEGQAACWMWDRVDNCFYLWRVMSPLYYGEINDVLYFSSARGVGLEGMRPLDQGVVYRLGREGLKALLDFKYNTPYGM